MTWTWVFLKNSSSQKAVRRMFLLTSRHSGQRDTATGQAYPAPEVSRWGLGGGFIYFLFLLFYSAPPSYSFFIIGSKISLKQGVENQSLNELLKGAVFNPSDTFPINYKETKPTSLSYSIFSVPDTIMKAFFIVPSYFFLQCNKVGIMLASTL